MHEEPMRTVLVGTGSWAQAHARALQKAKGIELIGIAGHGNHEILNAMAREFNAAPSMDLAKLLRDTQPRIVDLACNPHYRLEGIQLAQEHGVQIINVEKPLALTYQEGREIERLCNEHGIKLTVNHQKKFMRGWNEMSSRLANHELGHIQFMRAGCQGNILEQGTHIIDMVLYFNQFSRPLWVVGQVGDLEGMKKQQAAAPDMTLAEVSFENEVRCLFELGSIGPVVLGETSKWWQFAVTVFGEKGRIQATLNRGCMVEYYDGRKPIRMDTNWDRDSTPGLIRHFEELVRYAREETTHISCLKNSMLSFKVAMGIYQSALSRARINLANELWPDVVERLLAKLP